jgi:hypothetical protein
MIIVELKGAAPMNNKNNNNNNNNTKSTRIKIETI